ncbi:complement regulator-acquiring protein [Borreliella burgdorferi]|uniref:complement regulator-acquiring protein n=1 Tax=Borreliella burgdorferi TaxID=139 RepID=UPI001E5BF20C|nr:complement regulator-acquiring protein [Borreliella burgdorferi]MCD2375775.1 complement regulator-acquiring protein [Borreliella burgdorferi]MDO7257033.1 complement regulator-acquiring protein [Borreliella burgdorferi]
MTKAKLNIIKINTIAMILTLICTSCAPFSKIDPKANANTKPKKITNPGENTQNFEDKSGDLSASDEKIMETIASELKAIGKELEDQKKEENIQIAKIAKEKFDFLSTFKVGPYDLIDEDIQMKIKRTLYSSLDYKKENIEKLKEILEILKKNSKHYNIIGRLIYHISWSIQFQIEQNLELIQNGVENLSQEESKSLLMQIKSNLEIKQRLKKTLNETLKVYNQNTQDNEKILAEHFNKYYKDFDTLKPAFY